MKTKAIPINLKRVEAEVRATVNKRSHRCLSKPVVVGFKGASLCRVPRHKPLAGQTSFGF
jgi:hypothetical protein